MFKNLFRKTPVDETTKTGTTILAPLSGKIMRLEDIADPVFAQKMVGDGIAIEPTSNTVVSPVAGTLTQLFPSGHAAGITTDNGIEILIHVGLDTVELKGNGFQLLAKQGQKVEVGTKLIQLDLPLLRKTAKSLVTPIVITNMQSVNKLEKTSDSNVITESNWILKVWTDK